MRSRCGWLWRCGALLAAIPATCGGVVSAAPAPAIELVVRQVPLRAALERLYAGSDRRIDYPAGLPNPPVTAELHGVPRATALRVLLRQATGLTAQETPDAVVVRGAQVNTVTLPVNFSTGTPTGTSIGPGGTQVPNSRTFGVQATRRLENGQPAAIAGTGFSRGDSASTRPPLLPVTSRQRSGQSSSSNTFVTVTILPDPLDEVRGRRGR